MIPIISPLLIGLVLAKEAQMVVLVKYESPVQSLITAMYEESVCGSKLVNSPFSTFNRSCKAFWLSAEGFATTFNFISFVLSKIPELGSNVNAFTFKINSEEIITVRIIVLKNFIALNFYILVLIYKEQALPKSKQH